MLTLVVVITITIVVTTAVLVGQTNPRKRPSYSQMMIKVFNHLLSMVFRFHYHTQKGKHNLEFQISERDLRMEKAFKLESFNKPISVSGWCIFSNWS